MKKILRYQYYCYSILIIILIWIGLSYIYNNSLIIPKIDAVFESLGKILSSKNIYIIVLKTFGRIILTILISSFISIFFAVLSYRFRWFNEILKPGIIIIKTIPIVAIIILLFMTVGPKETPYIVTAFIIIPIIYEGTLNSFMEIHSGIKDEVRMLSKNNFNIMLRIYVPITLPYIITSLLQSLGLGIKVMVMAEYMSPTNNTIGAEIRRYYNNNDLSNVFALVIIILILVAFLEVFVNIFKKKFQNNE